MARFVSETPFNFFWKGWLYSASLWNNSGGERFFNTFLLLDSFSSTITSFLSFLSEFRVHQSTRLTALTELNSGSRLCKFLTPTLLFHPFLLTCKLSCYSSPWPLLCRDCQSYHIGSVFCRLGKKKSRRDETTQLISAARSPVKKAKLF